MVLERLFVNAKKPEGRLGRMMVSGMNGGTHERLARWGMGHFRIHGDVLDIGCGGGGNIMRMLALDTVDTVSGLDYSEVSVQKSKEVNSKAISDGRCIIVQGNVMDIPFEQDAFDTVTAFETVYFWPDMRRSFDEVFRVTRPGGTFAITNESNGTDKESAKYARIIDGMSLYTPEQLSDYLRGSGFVDVESFSHEKEPWITVVAWKPERCPDPIRSIGNSVTSPIRWCFGRVVVR
jgi:SAM-dependent methyltransferase